MTRGFETFEHTADIGIRAWGSEFSELFEEAAKALFDVMVDLKTVTPSQKLKVELKLPLTHTPFAKEGRAGLNLPYSVKGRGESEGFEELFLAWLQELLFISDTKHLMLSEFKVLELTPDRLKAEVSGETANAGKHVLKHEVKAVTRHQFKLVQKGPRYFAEAILDI